MNFPLYCLLSSFFHQNLSVKATHLTATFSGPLTISSFEVFYYFVYYACFEVKDWTSRLYIGKKLLDLMKAQIRTINVAISPSTPSKKLAFLFDFYKEKLVQLPLLGQLCQTWRPHSITTDCTLKCDCCAVHLHFCCPVTDSKQTGGIE